MIEIHNHYSDFMYWTTFSDRKDPERDELEGIWQAMYARLLGWDAF